MTSILHEIRDPIHGFILFDDLERDLINSRPYQRLRRVKQLAMTHLVYPGAMHTRFEHSLGVMEFATQIFEVLERKQRSMFRSAFELERDADVERARRILRLAALLHDVGHAPFSHTSEGLLSESHEQRSARVVRDSVIRQILEEDHYRHGVHVDDVVPALLSDGGALPTALAQFQREIITGSSGPTASITSSGIRFTRGSSTDSSTPTGSSTR